MNAQSTHFQPFTRKNRLFSALFCLLVLICTFFMPACKKGIDYLSYVSELRSNILLAQTDEFALRIFATQKETPYVADGVKREMTSRTEVYLTAPSGMQNYSVSFDVDGETYGGELSYNNVNGEYYFSCTLDLSQQTELTVMISCEKQTTTLVAKSVLSQNVLTPKNALYALIDAQQDTFSALTDEYGFAGEIRVRLIYEENPYYFIGITDKNGNTTAFLLSASTGKILAKHQG